MKKPQYIVRSKCYSAPAISLIPNIPFCELPAQMRQRPY